jgi:3-oxoadipate enol-lactonase
MGGAVAQLTWLRHRRGVAGVVLCSTARNFRGTPRERLFFLMLTAAMQPLSGYALAQVDHLAQTLPTLPSIDASDPVAWARLEFRSTSAWSLPEAVRELGRFNSAPWIHQVDVPTAVVVTAKDHTIPARRQRRLAAAIDGAHVYTASAGHASLVLDAGNWVPVFLDAIRDVTRQIPSQQSMSAPAADGDGRSA